jgi:8-hydroxy-5-deazaflavin:NADPH oxidoreductase
MKIAIIGSGNVGGALAQGWVRAGHQVVIGAKFPLSDKNQSLATVIGEDKFMGLKEAVQASEVVLIATPPTAIFEVIAEIGDVTNKVLIDATNAVRQKPQPYETVYHALVDKTAAQVVKCFNTTGFENMLDPTYGEVKVDLFMAGDSEDAKKVALQLALDAGFGTCMDFGKGDKVVLQEQFALSWINLAIMQGHGRNMAFKVVWR